MARALQLSAQVMPKPSHYDISFKELLARNFLALLRWLLPDVTSARVLKLPEELPATARRVDLIIQVRYRRRGRRRVPDGVIIFECQVQRDASLGRTMLLRAVLAHTVYQQPVQTILLALSPQAVVPADYVYGTGPDGEALCHRVTVRRVFAESADAALRSELAELLPLITTMQPEDGDHAALLRRVVDRILLRIPDTERRTMMLEQAQNFATLRLPRQKIDGIVREALRRHGTMIDPLRDFPYVRDSYRRGIREGIAKGEAKGEAKGLAKGEAKGLARAILTLLEARGLRVNKPVRSRILACTDELVLERWLRSAVSAARATDVLQAS